MNDAFKKHIRFPLEIDKVVRTISEEKDFARYIDQLIHQVLLTNPGERINRPDFGCGIKQMVFMPLNDATSSLTQVMIYQALENWLGKVIEVNQVTVNMNGTILIIDIAYTIRLLGKRKLYYCSSDPYYH